LSERNFRIEACKNLKKEENEMVAEEGQPSPASPSPGKSKRFWVWIILLGILGAAALGGYWWFFLRNQVSTDDAYIHADIAQISSRIDGRVLQVLVENHQPVEVGQVLFRLDPKDFQVAVDQSRAVIQNLEAQIQSAEINISLTGTQTLADVETAGAGLKASKEQVQAKIHLIAQLEKNRLAAAAEMKNAQSHYRRYQDLYSQKLIAQQDRDDAFTAFEAAQANLKAIDDEIASTRSSLKAIQQGIEEAQAQLETAVSNRKRVQIQQLSLKSLNAQRKAAQAQLEQAALNLSYCTVHAPIQGYVDKKNVQVGDWVKAGQSVMAIVPLEAVYIRANFKETQLADVRLGQPAKIEADLYPGFVYHGKVAGIAAGTGAAFSLLPPENATGNWIKVVQRVPVRINLDSPPPPDHPLRVGLSLHVTIDTSDQSGPRLRPLEKGKN
jgi:membrane fusion protein (multidrug efflux system)